MAHVGVLEGDVGDVDPIYSQNLKLLRGFAEEYCRISEQREREERKREDDSRGDEEAGGATTGNDHEGGEGGSIIQEDKIRELDDVVKEISNSGVIRFPWEEVKLLLAAKMEQVLFNSWAKWPDLSLQFGQTFGGFVSWLSGSLKEFSNPPFTIQRICELLADPHKTYPSTSKLVFALSRLLSVITVQRPVIPAGVTIPPLIPPRSQTPQVDATGGVSEESRTQSPRATRKRKADDQTPSADGTQEEQSLQQVRLCSGGGVTGNPVGEVASPRVVE